MLARTTIAVAILTLALPAQTGRIDQILDDPEAAVAAMPVQEPVVGGVRLRVVDGETGAPVAGADVLVVAFTTAARGRAAAVNRRSDERGVSLRIRTIAAYAVAGSRFRTDEAGAVVVPADSSMLAMHGARLGRPAMVDATIPLHPRRTVRARVVDAHGNGVAGVPLVLGRHTAHEHVRAKTGRDGTCEFGYWPAFLQGGEVMVHAGVAATQPITASFDPLAPPDAPFELRVPECGQVRFILYDEHERPTDKLRAAAITVAATREPRVHASTLEPDNCTFSHVELGHDVEVHATVEGMPQSLTFRGKGPTRAGELVVVEGRLKVSEPVVTFRVVDEGGRPVARESVGVVLRRERQWSHRPVETDDDGRVRMPTKGEFERLLVVRRRESEATDYRGAATIALSELGPGSNDLGDLQLQAEPVAGRARLVDEAGAPLAGVWVRANSTWTTMPDDGLGGGGGGSSRPGTWFFEHRVRTDDDGWFELREHAPEDVAWRIQPEGREHVAPGGLSLAPGTKDATLRAWSTCKLTLDLGEQDLVGLKERVRFVHRETGQVMQVSLDEHGLQLAFWACGTYDVQLGDERIGCTITDVRAPAGGETSDPRLHPVDLAGKAQLLRVTVVDDAGAPVPRAMVWCLVARPGGGRGGKGHRTDAHGRATFFAPVRGFELKVEADGHATKVVDEPGAGPRVELRRIPSVTIAVPTLPDLPRGVEARVGAARAGRATRLLRVVDGKVTVEPDALGDWQLRLSLQCDRRARLTQEVQRQLRQVFRGVSVTFDFEVTDEPGAPRTFVLDDEQKKRLAEALEAARAVLDRDGR